MQMTLHSLYQARIHKKSLKTECILFGSKRKLRRVSSFSVSCNGQIVLGKKDVKYLGSSLDQCMSGKVTIQNIIKKASAGLKFLYRQGSFLTPNIVKHFGSYSALHAYFDYTCSSWFAAITQKSKLLVIQNNIVRLIKNDPPHTHIIPEELQHVKMLNVHWEKKGSQNGSQPGAVLENGATLEGGAVFP